MQKSLDRKLAAIHADPHGSKEFILADAKDQDMAFGTAAPGIRHSHESPRDGRPYRSYDEFLNQIRGVIRQGIVDIVLMSASTSERLALRERLFENSAVTPAARANDTTDIWVARGASYPRVASRPFRTATLDQIQCGKARCEDAERGLGPDLGLYSITFMNDRDLDLAALEAYKSFRLEAEAAGFRHFLEIFDPNVSGSVEPPQLAGYINDQILRTLAGVPSASRPIFLKTVFHGARFVEEIVHYDPRIVVGVLGGSAGTTFDAFDLLHQAKKAGARAALFGRKINGAEHQTAFVKFLRLIADDELGPAEAVRAYHGVLQGLGIKPVRELKEDLLATVDLHAGDELSTAAVVVPDSSGGSGYGAGLGGTAKPSVPAVSASSAPKPSAVAAEEPEPDFGKMTLEEKLEYNRRRRDRIFG